MAGTPPTGNAAPVVWTSVTGLSGVLAAAGDPPAVIGVMVLGKLAFAAIVISCL